MNYRLARSTEGSSAIEFAILAPVFFLVVMTMIGYGIYLSASHSIQQITADAARVAVAGLNANEREELATDYIENSVKDYSFINEQRLGVTVEDDPANRDQFTVAINFDASELPIWNLYAFAMPDHVIRRFATIRVGGI